MEKLPQELLTDRILLKLPKNSLGMLKCVSKYLDNFISSRSFVYDHLHHSQLLHNNNPSLLISSRSIVVQSNKHNDHLLHHSQLLDHNDPSSLLISSPSSVLPFEKYENKARTFKVEVNNYTCNFTTSSTSTAAVPATEIAKLHCPLESTVVRDSCLLEYTDIRASCNGLLYLHGNRRRDEDDNVIERKRKRSQLFNVPMNTIGYIWNPCTNEYKELPPAPPLTLLIDPHYCDDDDYDRAFGHSSSSGFCGFGYDRTNDEYKILYYENQVVCCPSQPYYGELKHINSIVEFKLYTLGTNTWTRIVHNPYKSFYFKETSKRNKIGLLVNGALHWIMGLSDPASKAGKIISFDIEMEVFREVQKPHYPSEKVQQQHYYESLQVLQECLCICQIHPDYEIGVNEIDIWMLKDYSAKKADSWTKLFKVMIPVGEFKLNHFKLFRYYENNGEIVMLKKERDVIVYNTVNHTSRRVEKLNEVVKGCWKYYMDYTPSLVSLNSGTSAKDSHIRYLIGETDFQYVFDKIKCLIR